MLYYKASGTSTRVQSQRNLAKFMKILMVKRLESSFHAFRLRSDRFIHSYERVIAEFKKGNVYISKKHIGKIFELLESDDQEGIERLLEEDKAERLSRQGFLRRVHHRPRKRSEGTLTPIRNHVGESHARPEVGMPSGTS